MPRSTGLSDSLASLRAVVAGKNAVGAAGAAAPVVGILARSLAGTGKQAPLKGSKLGGDAIGERVGSPLKPERLTAIDNRLGSCLRGGLLLLGGPLSIQRGLLWRYASRQHQRHQRYARRGHALPCTCLPRDRLGGRGGFDD